MLAICTGLSPVAAPSAHAQGGGIVVNEFLATSDEGLLDEDGDPTDWIEVSNTGTSAVDLNGWFLTDDPAFLSKWRLPSLLLEPGAFEVIFASGKDRALAGAELHTSFALDAEGEFLALVLPDGLTIAHAYSPAFPSQSTDISFGIAEDATAETLVSPESAARLLVPSSGALGLSWTLPAFADAGWTSTFAAIGYDDGVEANPGGPGENLARGGSATQSSTDFGGAAARAIDGNTSGVYGNGSITHTANEAGAWWRVDLGDEFTLDSVVLWNRTDCCVERLTNFRVSVLDAAQGVVTQSDHFTDGSVPAEQRIEIALPPGTRGRHVEVRKIGPDPTGAYWLSLAEVEVYEGVSSFAGLFETDVEGAVRDVNASCYLRVPFTLTDPSSFEVLDLHIQYDDGFVAYVNGTEIARRNAPASPSWSSAAPAARELADVLTPESIRVAIEAGLLRAGANVLAVHVLNAGVADGDLLLRPTLEAKSVLGTAQRFFVEPTPGAPNDGPIYEGIVSDTTFTADRGFYDAPFDVEVATATPGASIRYTLDGSTPSPTSGRLYGGPIRIETTTVLRAIAYRDRHIPTNVDTHTYVFLDDVITSDVMNPAITQAPAYAPQMHGALTDLPSMSLVSSATINDAVEVPTSLELIWPDGSSGFQENGGVKLYGGAFTSFEKKNFRVYFRSEYGAKKLRFPLFAGHDRGVRAVEVFDQLELRSGSHDMNQRGFYMSNRFTDDTMLDMGNLNPHGQFVHLYLNGEYWGQYHLRERWNADMLAQYLGGEKEDYEAINGNWNVGGWAEPGVPYDGDGSAWTRIKSLRDDYVAVNPYLDVQHYVDYMLMFMFGNAEDEYRCVGPTVPGSGFKWFLNDADGFLRSVGSRTGMGQPGRQSGDGPGSIFSMLLAEGHPDYLTLLGDRVHKHFFNDGAMTPAKNAARLLERCAEVERAFIAESARWGYRSPTSWSAAKNDYVNNVLPGRTATVISQYRAAGFYPDVEAPTFNHPGGLVEPGLVIAPGASVGTLYYTTNGADPRLPGGAVSPEAIESGGSGTPLLAAGAPVRVLVPTDGALGTLWTEPGFDDSGWTSGTSGVGYERSSGFEADIGTDVEGAMYQIGTSVYMRFDFDVDDPGTVAVLTLGMKHDDGFVAYLNGIEVASANAPASPAWDSVATASHDDALAVELERFDISRGIPALRAGRNVLAVHGMNRTAASSDLLFLPEIYAADSDSGLVITIDEPVLVRARVRLSDGWSALNEALFYFDIPLRVTEVMYNPRSTPQDALANDAYEFIEVQNIGTGSLALDGLRISGGIDYEFSSGVTTLGPGEVALIVGNATAFTARYPFLGATILGEFSRNLRNSQDQITLTGAIGEPILDFRYSDRWYPETDGAGASLEIADARADRDTWGEPGNWRASVAIDGTPGTVDGGQPPTGGLQFPGDVNQDAVLDISDAVNLLSRLFLGDAGALPCDGQTVQSGGNLLLADVSGDSRVDLTDAVGLLNYLFLNGPPPARGTRCVRIEGCPDQCVP